MLRVFHTLPAMTHTRSNNSHRSIRRVDKTKLIEETAEMYWSQAMQMFIDQEQKHPKKSWVFRIIRNEREQDAVRMQHKDFILIPDTQNIYKRCTHLRKNELSLNWLVICTDPNLHNIRDLRSEHIPMLENMRDMCLAYIQQEYPQIQIPDIMMYANYPPSVHVLHFHICFPFFNASAYDSFRMHSITSILNNLKLSDGEYYKQSTLLVPVHQCSPWYASLLPPDCVLPNEREGEILPSVGSTQGTLHAGAREFTSAIFTEVPGADQRGGSAKPAPGRAGHRKSLRKLQPPDVGLPEASAEV